MIARSSVEYQVLVTAAVFLGLFFVEYPPLFLLGYWTWGAFVHKTLSGVFLILNLVAGLQVWRRLGSKPDGKS
jgi:hypothetical protein